jgi:hypothetical protein
MQEQETYTIQELFEDLPLSIRQLAEEVHINEVTLARIRDGKTTRRATANKLLVFLSKLYERPLSLRNVTGINVQAIKRPGKKEQRDTPEAA